MMPKSYGGTVSSINLDGFDSDLLLLTAKLKDPNFNKYFLFVLREMTMETRDEWFCDS